MRSKYGNKKIEADGHKFDSKLEHKYYQELLIRKRSGDIRDFTLQPRYELQPKYKKPTEFGGVKRVVRKIEYVADFNILHNDYSVEVVDIKGAVTDVFALKRKMFEYKYTVKLSVLKYTKAKGWYEV